MDGKTQNLFVRVAVYEIAIEVANYVKVCVLLI